MDGFDDLLAPSRSVLEDNPFADPFAKRSNSPDPWASPFANTTDDNDRSVTPTTDSYATADHSERSSIAGGSVAGSIPLPDQLDSTVHTADNDGDKDDEPLGRVASPRSPGFRESIPAAFSEIATIRPTEKEESGPAVSTPSLDSFRSATPTIGAEIVSPLPQTRHTIQASWSAAPPSPSTSKSEVVSPLTQPAPITIDRSFAGLALGGESPGGWQSEEGAWGNDFPASTSADDDSDDDKPIGQSVKRHEILESRPVSIVI